jgi:hypothetical protein
MNLFQFHARVFVLILGLSGADAKGLLPSVTGLEFTAVRGGSSISQVDATTEERRAAAKAMVEKYWLADPRDRYLLLAESYKSNLRRLGITNAAKYGSETQPPERIWGTRTYQRVDFSRDPRQGRDLAQVVLSIDWEQEGYRGTTTYIFDLIVEAGQWRIRNIVH